MISKEFFFQIYILCISRVKINRKKKNDIFILVRVMVKAIHILKEINKICFAVRDHFERMHRRTS